MTELTSITAEDVVVALRNECDAPGFTAWAAPYEAATVANQCYQIVHYADAQRGGIVFVGSGSSGLTFWTDASTPHEVLARYLSDDMIN